MKKHWTLALLLVGTSQVHAFSLDDIQFWTGEGSHRAGLVIQWNDGGTPVSLAWGLRFEGTENTESLLMFPVFFDPRLFMYAGPHGGFGLPVYGLGYDSNASGVTGDGFTNAGSTPDDATVNDANDRWQVGWLSRGFWSLKKGVSGDVAGGWTDATQGVSDDLIQDKSWRALTFGSAANGWVAPDPTGIVAASPIVPEPSVMLALAAGLALMKRKRRS